MSPIRTAIIGLSASSAVNWARHAHLPYLLSSEGRAKFQIVALCNSSVDAAKRAIDTFKLPPETRAYGDPETLAADPDVQLVVCATRVDKHYETILPSVHQGKDAYVEWPLAQNAELASELAALAREKGSKTVVGLQGWHAPAIITMRELIRSGRIGKVLSSEVRASGGSVDRLVLPTSIEYFTDRKIGGNSFTIGFGHLFDFVQVVLGDIQVLHSQLQIQRPDVKMRDRSTGKIVKTVRSDVPDLIHVTGSLPGSEHTTSGATVHLRFRRGQAFKGEDPLVWSVNGERGEIRLSASDGPGISAGAHAHPVTIEVHDFDTDEVEKVKWSWNGREELNVSARMVGAQYEAFATGDETKYATFEHASKRHKQLNEMLAQFQTE
ncbi:NAD(P)-binding protein [Daldinia caldariorum]|uniref:NAD(P)-binding protein n=1 Tax=Daldinia caldariorum TaxID=326644 RepID=UPI0020072172|nr:NAD(P)-binding protein [Daldinia caldariorum]KAI1470397.1 NAD(P)-binding protein [Daldinia caldariorum]